jgi:hypothetical protein
MTSRFGSDSLSSLSGIFPGIGRSHFKAASIIGIMPNPLLGGPETKKERVSKIVGY